MGVQSKQYINNLKGDLLVLSVNQVASWLTSDNTTGITSGTQLNITTPDECEQQCALVPGCNGWNFCNRTDGCGIGCLEYHIHTEPCKHHLTLGIQQLALKGVHCSMSCHAGSLSMHSAG